MEPSNSAVIRKRLDVVLASKDYSDFLVQLDEEKIKTDDFKVEYPEWHKYYGTE